MCGLRFEKLGGPRDAALILTETWRSSGPRQKQKYYSSCFVIALFAGIHASEVSLVFPCYLLWGLVRRIDILVIQSQFGTAAIDSPFLVQARIEGFRV